MDRIVEEVKSFPMTYYTPFNSSWFERMNLQVCNNLMYVLTQHELTHPSQPPIQVMCLFTLSQNLYK